MKPLAPIASLGIRSFPGLFSGVVFLLALAVGRTVHAVDTGPDAVVRPAADTTAPVSGLSGWVVSLYHHDLFLYGLTVVAVMAVMGIAIGFAMDYFVSRLGIDLGRLEHRE